jgi:hypothetical protein
MLSTYCSLFLFRCNLFELLSVCWPTLVLQTDPWYK